MTNTIGKTGSRLVLALGTVLGLGLTGCGPAATTSTGTVGGNVGTGASSSRVASATTTTAATSTAAPRPGVGKGRWVIESAPATGTFVRRRVWVPDDGSAPVTTPDVSDARQVTRTGVANFGNRPGR